MYPDETSHNEPSHLVLKCLQCKYSAIVVFCALRVKSTYMYRSTTTSKK